MFIVCTVIIQNYYKGIIEKLYIWTSGKVICWKNASEEGKCGNVIQNMVYIYINLSIYLSIYHSICGNNCYNKLHIYFKQNISDTTSSVASNIISQMCIILPLLKNLKWNSMALFRREY